MQNGRRASYTSDKAIVETLICRRSGSGYRSWSIVKRYARSGRCQAPVLELTVTIGWVSTSAPLNYHVTGESTYVARNEKNDLLHS